VSKNLTLTISEDVLLAARKIALDRKTSVNAMVREYLESLTTDEERHKANMAELDRIFAAKPARLGKITWSRADLYER